MVVALLRHTCPLWLASLWGGPLLLTGAAAEPPRTADHGLAIVGADARLTFLVRRALLQDEELAPFNIGVQVHGGRATLIGRVPSPELASKAEAVARKVAGLSGLRNELLVGPPAEESVLRMPAAAPPAMPPSKPPAAPPGHTVSLFAPIPDEREEAPQAPAGPPRPRLAALEALQPRPVSDAALLKAIDRVRWSDPRFLRIQAEVRGGIVSLHGEVSRAADGMDFARLVARIPGVIDVILQTREVPLLPGRTP
jgi:hypothetical protein